MAFSDNIARQNLPSPKNRKIYQEEKTWWSDSQKLEAAKTYLAVGNVAVTARMLKIPDDTMRRWRKTQWWADLVGELKLQDDMMLSARLKKIIEKSFEAVEDRLENGDWVYDQKTGSLRRKHVSMRDAHKVAIDLVDKREILLGRQTPTISEQQVEDKLATLADKFASMVNKKISPPNQIVEAEIIEISSEDT